MTMTWPWLVALLLAWSTIGAVTAHATHRWLSRRHGVTGTSAPPTGPIWDAIIWAELLVMAIGAGALWPVPLTVWARGRR